MLPKLPSVDSIATMRRRFPGALVCATCARLIASTPKGYAKQTLTPEQVENYLCAACRSDDDPSRSAEVTARFAASKAAAEAARLRAPLSGLSPCICAPIATCASCLQMRAAEAAEGRRIAHDYLDTCATNGHHADLDALADCPHPSATVGEVGPSPAFCEHGRPVEVCAAHVKLSPGTPMPAALARCESCGGWHGKNGRDRCPYSRTEAAAVRAARETAYRPGMLPVGDSGSGNPRKIKNLPGTISHLGSASKRLRRKAGRPATGKSKWAGIRRKRRRDTA